LVILSLRFVLHRRCFESNGIELNHIDWMIASMNDLTWE